MPIVTLRGPLQKLAGDGGEHRVDGATVTEFLQELERSHSALEGWILDERGVLRRHINVFVNGERVKQDAPVAAEDRIEILPAISGGSPGDDSPSRPPGPPAGDRSARATGHP
ncbi:MAG: MoaD/ThiS family protein [Actinobacteria bacterium]|nr:MoaD/ThiS family protein [Actinomycetota bacterium]